MLGVEMNDVLHIRKMVEDHAAASREAKSKRRPRPKWKGPSLAGADLSGLVLLHEPLLEGGGKTI